MKQRGWYSRGYLPHLDVIGEIQEVTFRLADALPVSLVARWQRSQRLKVLIAQYEDAGHGSCLLREPECATIVQEALLFFDNERYRLMEWCIMPNHIHVIVKTMQGSTLDQIVRSWKGFTARKINE